MIKTIFITGVAGFIGSQLAKGLSQENLQIIGIDNFNEYYDSNLKRDRVDDLMAYYSDNANSILKIEEVDINDTKSINKLFEKYNPDLICHLAGQPGVRYSLKEPQSYVHNNVLGTLNLLEISKSHSVSDFVFASTSSVYGLSNEVPFNETTPIDSPISVYSSTKYACEMLCHSYHRLYGIKFRILRFFTVYGPWGRPDMAVFSFTKKILEGQPLEVYNYGKMKRDFTYVEDIVAGINSAIFHDSDYDVINLGCGRPVELMDFIQILEDSIGKKAKTKMKPLQPGDVEITWADVSKAKKVLNYEPRVPLEVGIPKFVEWYFDYYKI